MHNNINNVYNNISNIYLDITIVVTILMKFTTILVIVITILILFITCCRLSFASFSFAASTSTSNYRLKCIYIGKYFVNLLIN